MYISLWENSRGHPDNVSFMQFSTKIDGFEQKDSQGFENSYNSYEQYPLEKFFIFTIYRNYTLALRLSAIFFITFQYYKNQCKQMIYCAEMYSQYMKQYIYLHSMEDNMGHGTIKSSLRSNILVFTTSIVSILVKNYTYQIYLQP